MINRLKILKHKKILLASLGNVIEWFDFGLFLFLAPILGAHFFPQETPFMATCNALVVFATGFLCRPLGGILFGHFGDTRGRVTVLKISIILITLSTTLVGFLPSYEKAGWVTTVLFILLRFIQGLSIGGEYSGMMIFLAESAPPNRRGFFTSFAATGANLGFLMGSLTLLILNWVFSPQELADWGWRLPFILIGLPGFYIVYTRFKFPETQTYIELDKQHQLKSAPFTTAITSAPLQLLKIFGLTCMSSTFYYVFFGFMPSYLKNYMGFSYNKAFSIQSLLLVLMLFLVPVAGMFGDTYSRKNLLIITASLIVISVIPFFYLFQTHSLLWIITAWGAATLISSLDQGNSLVAVVENCSPNIRYSGVAFSYNLGMALFGGTAPLLVSVLVEKVSLTAPAYYLMIMATISLITAMHLLPKNHSMKALGSE